jgi:hypothetical protein
MRGRAGRLLANGALAAVSLLAAFAIGEAFVRTFQKDQTLLFPRYQAAYRYGRYTLRGTRPSLEFWHTSPAGSWRFVTNSRGFRSTREYAHAKPAGTLRVLSLGDSHTQGYEVRQDLTYSSVLERYLNHRGIRAEVINTGVSGFSTAEELAFLENEGVLYQPDVVVLAFFANDYDDNLKAGLFGLDAQDGLSELKHEHIPGVRIQDALYAVPFTKWLGENSYFYSALFNGVWKFFKDRLEARAAARAAAASASQTQATPGFEYAVSTAEPDRYRKALAAALIVRMQRFCAERGIRLILVDLPQRPAPYSHTSSLAPALVKALDAGGVEYVTSDALFAGYDGAADFHVPAGLLHVSEFTHTLIGVELGRRLVAGTPPPAAR